MNALTTFRTSLQASGESLEAFGGRVLAQYPRQTLKCIGTGVSRSIVYGRGVPSRSPDAIRVQYGLFPCSNRAGRRSSGSTWRTVVAIVAVTVS